MGGGMQDMSDENKSTAAGRMGWSLGTALLLLLGASTATVSVLENPSADFEEFGFHVIRWVGFFLLPFSSGLALRLAFTVLPSLGHRARASTRLILVVGLVGGLVVLMSDQMFEIENRNNVFLGMTLAGLAVGNLLAPPNVKTTDAGKE